VSHRGDANTFRLLTGPHGMTYQPGLDGVRDKAAGHDVSTAVMISCQWELVSHQLPGRGDRQYSIGTPAFDDYVRLRYEEVADRIIAAGVDRILWMTCPYLSSSTGVDGLSPRLAASRDPARVDRLNAIITTMSAERDDVDVLSFSEWVNERSTTPPSVPTAHTSSSAATTPPPTRSSTTSTLPWPPLLCERGQGLAAYPITQTTTDLGRPGRRASVGRRSPRSRRTCARCAGSGRSGP
jgi:hypothetical protein